MLQKKASSEPDKCKRIFKVFITKFHQIIVGDHTDLKETSIAIKGYGSFAGVS